MTQYKIISGGIGIFWYIFWAIFTANTPEQHRWISEEEKTYIITEVEKQKSKNVITVSDRSPGTLRLKLTTLLSWSLSSKFTYKVLQDLVVSILKHDNIYDQIKTQETV